MPKLESLCLQGTQIDDDGLARIAGIAGITALDVSRTRVTDDGIEAIDALNRFEKFRPRSDYR